MNSILLVFTLPILISTFWICEDHQPIAADSFSEEGLSMLRSEVREIIRPKCGSCHTSGLPTAKAKALAVFDLKNEAWSSRMNTEQLGSFSHRLSDVRDSSKVKVERLLLAERARR